MGLSVQIYQFGEFTLDVARGCVLRNGQEIKLRPKVYETLKYLVEHPGQLIGKQELIHAVWPDAFVTDDSLVQCTVELRRALGDSGPKLLKTVPRRGYIFNASVTKGLPPAASGLTGHPSPADTPTLSFADQPAAAGPAGKRHDLPTPRTSLIGREREVANAADLLLREDVRLLSLTGTGGAGKTRLAIAVAEAVAHRFTAGVHFVALASILDSGLVSSAIAESLGIQRLSKRSVPQLIADQLRDSGPFLLVLDNFEQVLPAAKLLAETLEACPSLKILVTTRACLHIYGEQDFPVTPLTQNSAIELFVQRASAVWPGFDITAENAPAIREICSRLDGLPLAIELAAARTKVLSPPEMLARLRSRLQLLTQGALDLPERQQALRKTIDWSHDLLNDSEQKLLRRLSVFVGGCTLEAAEAVCNTGFDLGMELFEGLSSLVDKNLIQRVDPPGNETRFSMLETIREYALERLAGAADDSSTRQAHAAYCLVLAEEGNPEMNSADRASWLARCDLEIDNFRCALDWLFETREQEWALRLCIALFRFWDMREHLAEGRARLEAALHLAGESQAKERCRVLHFLGAVATTQGDFSAAKQFLEEGLRLYERLDDQWGIAASYNALAITARDRGDYAAAETNFERSLVCWRRLLNESAIARCLHNLANVLKARGDYLRARRALREATQTFNKLGDRSGAAWSINQQGDVAREQGDLSGARQLYQQALSTFRETGNRWGVGRSLSDLGCINCEQGNYSAANAAYHEAMEIFLDLGHRRGIARALEGYACLALARGHASRALMLAAAAAHLRQLISAPLPQAERVRLEQAMRPAWESLTGPEADRAWAAGSAMDPQKAVRFSLDEGETAIAN